MENGLRILLIKLYEQKYRTTTGRVKFKFKRSPYNMAYIDRFLAQLQQHYGTLAGVGVDTLRAYLTHAFGRHVGRKFHGRENVLTIGWLLGKPTVLDFLQANRGRKWGMGRRLLERKEIKGQAAHEVAGTVDQQQKQQDQQAIYTAIPKHEEIERKRFLNSLKGYAWCAQETTMFHPLSPVCKECKRATQCQERQLLNYPSIHRLRATLNHD